MTVQGASNVQNASTDYGVVQTDYNKPVHKDINVFGDNRYHKFNQEAFGVFGVAQGMNGCAYGK